MFVEPAAGLFEVGRDERVLNFVQRTRKLFAIAASPFLATDEATDLATRKVDLAPNRPASVLSLDSAHRQPVHQEYLTVPIGRRHLG
jgi:hypothetical protein